MTTRHAHATSQSRVSQENATGYLFSPRHVAAGTVLAGPLCGGYLLARNFRSFGGHADAVLAALMGVVWTAVTIGLGLLFPEVPNVLFWIANGLLAKGLTRAMMGEALDQHEAAGGRFATGGQMFLAILPILAAELALFALFVLI